MNISKFSNHQTANTNADCAEQRAQYLSLLGINSVLELCVGPSLKVLEGAYKKYNIKVTGNDIEKRWQKYYSNGNWIIGDALSIDYTGFDCIVFAPPLSKNCSGKREDALSIFDVNPKFTDFIKKTNSLPVYKILVLPGRSLSTKNDRKQYYHLISGLENFSLIPLTHKNIVKYYDLLLG